jgi:cellulose synthase/poly-beta-1,6-N-acetylglucosamine synthase-like glycosyltransferase
MNILLVLFYLLSAAVMVSGGLALAYFPLAIFAELRSHRKSMYDHRKPLVSIIIPAYNESKVIVNCIESILSSNYDKVEIILVDDGSSDNTVELMKPYHNPPRVNVIAKPNGGKASALNLGYSQSRGEVLLFVDADGIFTPNTIEEMLRAFVDKKIGAICGMDAPVNLDRLLTRLMSVQAHVGTGLVRRALSELNCLPIVSGNVGAFRRTALERTIPLIQEEDLLSEIKPVRNVEPRGPFREGFIGEDLELTWRIHQAGFQVKFAPRALVMAESPSTIKGLWKQRVRWARGLLQTVRLHRDMFFNLKYGPLGLYLPINFYNMVIIPILQLLVVYLIFLFAVTGYSPVSLDLINLIAWTGLVGAMFTTLLAIGLDRSWKDLQYFYVLPLWIPYSLLLNMVMVWAITLELRGVESKWNKVDRTGVVSRRSLVEVQKEGK